MTTIPIRTGTTILEEIESVYDEITKRAYEIFLDRRGSYALDLEDWLAAEKQLLFKPSVDLTNTPDLFVLMIPLGGVDPAGLSILATPGDLLLHSSDPSCYPRVFRVVHFPEPIDPPQVEATYIEGTLVLSAVKTGVSPAFGAAPGRASTRGSPTVHR